MTTLPSPGTPHPTATRRVQRVRHELRRRELQVRQVQPLGPGFVRIVFGGDELEGFTSLSFDDHVKLLFDAAPGADPVRRDYTPRHFDPVRRELSIEFALHEQGAATDWARQAAPGQRLAIGGPRGSMIIPTDYAWHLLAGDSTALPAINRRLEELPAGAQALVLVQVASPADQRPWHSAAQVQTQWVHSTEAWLAALRALPLPAGEGFAWCAGEAQVMAQARALLVHEKGVPRECQRVSAYWKLGAQAFHEDIEG
ncbi:siderophore-interacting protein [Aquabacterium sp. OR-4]|uniref:siderophore-interacting protein n=1 Tax=Aquabacterium sp. OR-4 TaxID=2978127 RepID=UPI0021B21207|nr:siderophore-interacting protein [Aquabacterium sp. OR-4]MDT7838030.1 siderophore-interacting protein [Aquabacterium sp. OR-4]